VLDLIKSLKEHGVSVILISHRMDDVFYVADRVMAIFPAATSPRRHSSRPAATR
jgi:simple sugar transport system ATP-binding protein